MRRLAFLVCVLTFAAGLSAQGLDAAARKEKERRERNRQAGVKARVVSEEDVKSGASAEQPSAATGSSKEQGADSGSPSADLSRLEAPTTGGPSATSEARAKAERWRARYRPAKERIAALEREVKDLTDKASRIGAIIEFVGPGVPPKNPNVRTEAEAVVQRLRQARGELSSAKAQLESIEEGARRDGVPSGQLY